METLSQDVTALALTSLIATSILILVPLAVASIGDGACVLALLDPA